MKNSFISLFLTIFLSGCGLFDSVRPDVARAGQISHAFLDEVRERYPYYKPGGMGGAFCNQINGFLISFDTTEDISNERAEEEIQVMYQLLIDRINNDPVIRPYLADWPLEESETMVEILFFNPSNWEFRDFPKLACIGIRGGKVRKVYFYPPVNRLMTMEKIEEFEEKRRSKTD